MARSETKYLERVARLIEREGCVEFGADRQLTTEHGH